MSAGAMQGDTEEPPPPEQQLRLPRGGVRAGRIERDMCQCGGTVGREATGLAGWHQCSACSGVASPTQPTGFRVFLGSWYLWIMVMEGSGMSHSLSSSPSCRQPGKNHGPMSQSAPPQGSAGHTATNSQDSEAFIPQGMLDSIPVLCLTILTMCKHTKQSQNYFNFLPYFGNFPQKQQYTESCA